MSCNEEELLHATRNCIIDCSSPLRCVENTISTAKLHAKGGTASCILQNSIYAANAVPGLAEVLRWEALGSGTSCICWLRKILRQS